MKLRVKNLIINWGLLLTPVVGLFLAVLIAWLIERLDLVLTALTAEVPLGAKLTFLSIIIALGMFQYRYFYDETSHLEQRAQRGDYGPGWADYVERTKQMKELLQAQEERLAHSQAILATAQEVVTRSLSVEGVNALRAYEESVNATVRTLSQIRDAIPRMDKAIQRARTEFREIIRHNLLDFSVRLSLIFAIGILVFVSIAFSVVGLIWPHVASAAFLYSQSAFVASLVLFFVLFSLFLLVVQRQLRYHNREQ